MGSLSHSHREPLLSPFGAGIALLFEVSFVHLLSYLLLSKHLSARKPIRLDLTSFAFDGRNCLLGSIAC